MQLKRLSFLLLFICGYLTCVQSQTTVLNPQTDKKLPGLLVMVLLKVWQTLLP